MATLTSTLCQTSSGGFFLTPPKYIENGVIARSAVYTFTAAQSAGDVIQMVSVPKGCQIHDVILGSIVGGAAFTMTVGDGNATQRYVLSASASGSSTIIHAAFGVGYSYSAEDTIDIGIQAVASASAAGTVRLTVFYSMDQVTDATSS